MRGTAMYFKYTLLLLISVACVLSAGTPAHSEENKFNLKLGARGKVCLNCHVEMQDKLKNPFVHTPVKVGDCTGCHNPHTSSHGKLLAADPSKICLTCHKAMVPENARSAHKVVVDNNCIKCHDPHSAKNKFNLLQSGNELCFGCHKDMGNVVTKVKFKHYPVEKGCLTCHNPHASIKAKFLLRDEVPSLCLGCHKTNQPMFAKAHMNYPVQRARCTTCHNPHGSDRPGILFNNVHKPVASKMCNQCHEDPSSSNPFATRRPGFELCQGCHSGLIKDVFSKNRIHWPLLDKKSCLTCHNPHASPEPKLLKASMRQVCGACHADSIQRQDRSQTKHPPIKDGMCTSCHEPHAGDSPYFFIKPTVIELCGTCHDWEKHSSHPLGEKFIDPRNKNLTIQCLSCHRAHGTEHKSFIYASPVSALCTQCHVKYQR